MFRNTVLKINSFKATTPLLVVKGAVAIPSRSASSVNVPFKRAENTETIWSQERDNQVKLSEEEVRRFVVGLSTMLQDGKLRPSTSREQVILHFASRNDDNARVKQQVANQVDAILSKKTKVIKRKHDKTSVLEWIY